MSIAASRIIRFNNNVSLQNLIQRHLLRPSPVADSSATLLLNSENQTPLLYTLQAHLIDASDATKKKNYSDRDVSMIMFGLSGINQHGNLKMSVRRRADIDKDEDDDDGFPTVDADSGDESFGDYDDGFIDSGDDSEDPSYYEDDDIEAIRRSHRK